MKPKIFVTRLLPPKAMDKIASYFDMEVNPDDRVLDKAEILKGIQGKDALLSLLTDTIDAEVMDANPNIKVISNYAVGFNNVDVKAATKRKIPVCNTPGVLTETTADCAWALMLAAARRIVEGDRFTRAGKFHGWGPMMLLGNDVYGKTLGIVGMGRIGQAVAERSAGFDMKILYWDVVAHPGIEETLGAKKVELEELLKTSDFVSVHLPLFPETTHIIDEKALNLMKESAYLINTARGPIVDEKALVKALREKRIAGAGLDVYEEEPKLADGLIDLDNVILLPHLGSATIETRTAMGLLAAENAISIFEGKKTPAIANPEVLSK